MKTYLYFTDKSLYVAHREATGETARSRHRFRPEMSLTANLGELLARDPSVASGSKDEVEVILPEPVGVVPLSHFQEEDSEALYKYCFPEGVTGRVFYDVAPALDIVLLFGMSEAACRALEVCFPAAHYTAALTPVLRYLAALPHSAEGMKMYAWAREGGLDVVAFENNRLLAVNSYKTTSPSDAAFYILALASQLSANLQEVPFFIADDADGGEALRREVNRYAAKVEPLVCGIVSESPLALELLLCE